MSDEFFSNLFKSAGEKSSESCSLHLIDLIGIRRHTIDWEEENLPDQQDLFAAFDLF